MRAKFAKHSAVAPKQAAGQAAQPLFERVASLASRSGWVGTSSVGLQAHRPGVCLMTNRAPLPQLAIRKRYQYLIDVHVFVQQIQRAEQLEELGARS